MRLGTRGGGEKMKNMSKRRWRYGLAIALLAILIAGCRSANTVEVGDGDNGGQVTLEMSQVLVVTLESSPTTGSGWQLVANEDGILQQPGETEFKQRRGTGIMMGAPGKEILRFKATAPGETTLELVYRRPWETDVAPEKTYTLSVTVR
jgi:inhibitor of cysteine peptidase